MYYIFSKKHIFGTQHPTPTQLLYTLAYFPTLPFIHVCFNSFCLYKRVAVQKFCNSSGKKGFSSPSLQTPLFLPHCKFTPTPFTFLSCSLLSSTHLPFSAHPSSWVSTPYLLFHLKSLKKKVSFNPNPASLFFLCSSLYLCFFPF